MTRSHGIAVAIQGGGAHGAFAWGVLDALLDRVGEGGAHLVATSGAGSGAVSAAALAYGCHEGAAVVGPAAARPRRIAEGGRLKLRELWETIARLAFWGGNPFVAAMSLQAGWNIDASPAARWAEVAGATLPGSTVPGIGGAAGVTLGTVLREVMPDIPAIFARPEPGVPTVVVAATDVLESRRQLFVDGAVSPEALKASTCKPGSLVTVEIAGHHYWDGGYMGNPPLTCLVESLRRAGASDLVLITTNPLHRDEPPGGQRAAMDRLNELTFNAALMHEVNTIETINRLIDAGMITAPANGQHPYNRINLHRIHADAAIAALGVYSKEAPSWDFLSHLKALGRDAFAASWPTIEAALGTRSSWDTASACDQILSRHALAVPPPPVMPEVAADAAAT